jgi:alkanesulfonate monooxygenase SsuD/methylene tetrahydromethanopterin reductase-like flavin-dependent oxidoreductase (luciferase family)
MPADRKPVGVFILGDTPPANLIEMSRRVEDAGFDELWFAEDYFMISGFASAAIALGATSNINVGIGAISSRVRHPAVAAMEATTLAGAYPGRFDRLGIGHGVPAWTRQMKLYPKSVLTSMREAVTGVKRLAQGETLTEEGDYYGYDAVTLTHPAPDLRVLTAVVGPKSVDLCAEIADGLMISVLAGPTYVETVAKRIADVRGARGATDDFEIVTYVLACVGQDRAKARQNVRAAAAFYLEAMGETLITGVYGANDALGALLAKGGRAELEAEMPESWLDWLAVAGTPADCVDGINALFDAGSTSVVVCIVPSDELPAQLDLMGREVLPAL